jgi:hypothetical protein
MEIDASIVLDELVHQFADPMAFFRELIQNAIDAGTGDVDITVDFDPSGEDIGRMVVEIRDFGVGMDRQVIQNELLKLFNSGKDRDLTKIGRFGIGFVSVFAVEPDAVCVDTGRAGESWRLLFDRDRTYELFQRDVPFEGTSVRLFKRVSVSEFERFRMRAREVIFEWCKHVEVPIFFNGDTLGADFDIDSPCKVEMQTEGTRIVAGYVAQQQAPYGYYHSGLTLMEDQGGPWPHVSFKLDSRYLEHTLTRDQIIEDKNFHKALELLEQVVRQELPRKLIASLEDAVRSGDLALAEELARHLLRQPRKSNFWGRNSRLTDEQQRDHAIFPVLNGEPLTTADLARRNAIYWSEAETPLARVAARDATVLHSPDGVFAALAHALIGQHAASVHEAFVGIEVDEDVGEQPAEQGLAEGLAALLAPRSTTIEFGRLQGAERISGRAWVGIEEHRELYPVSSFPPSSLETARRSTHVVLNRRHELVRRLIDIAKTRPDWAALMLVVLTCPDATADDPGADALLREAFSREMGRQ